MYTFDVLPFVDGFLGGVGVGEVQVAPPRVEVGRVRVPVAGRTVGRVRDARRGARLLRVPVKDELHAKEEHVTPLVIRLPLQIVGGYI